MALRLRSLAGPAREDPSHQYFFTTMNRILLAIIASGVLFAPRRGQPVVTNTADLMHHARTVGVAGRSR